MPDDSTVNANPAGQNSETNCPVKYSDFKTKLSTSDIWSQIEPCLPKGSIDRFHCLGLGSPLQSNQALYQLVLVELITEHYKDIEVVLWDPIFDTEDIHFIESLGFHVEEHPDSKDPSQCLYYLPHFPINELEKFFNGTNPSWVLSNDLIGYGVKFTDREYFSKYPTCATIAKLLDTGVPQDDGFTTVRKKKPSKKKQTVVEPIAYDFEGMYFKHVGAASITSKSHLDTLNAFTDLCMMDLIPTRAT